MWDKNSPKIEIIFTGRRVYKRHPALFSATVVEVSLMVGRIVESILLGAPIELFLVPASALHVL